MYCIIIEPWFVAEEIEFNLNLAPCRYVSVQFGFFMTVYWGVEICEIGFVYNLYPLLYDRYAHCNMGRNVGTNWLLPENPKLTYCTSYKASELVPGSWFPRWNSMRFFGRGSIYDTSSLAKVRFATLYRQSSNTSRILKLVRYYVVIRSLMCRHCEISKKPTLNPSYPVGKNTPPFLLSDMSHSLKIFTRGMPLHAHVFSFTHNAVVLSDFRCVHPKNQTKFFWFYHFNKSKQMLLTQDLKWLLD